MLKKAATILLLTTFTASAGQVCGDRKSILETLGKEYGETPRFEGVTEEGNYIELLYSNKSGTYTAVLTEPRGRSCVVGSGIGNFFKNHDYSPQLNH